MYINYELLYPLSDSETEDSTGDFMSHFLSEKDSDITILLCRSKSLRLEVLTN